ncbi:MAG TPA: hypothetical protein VF255_08620 [Solirubrobacterales bacterium]
MQMNRGNPDAVKETILAAIAEDLACEVLADGSGRIGCLTPFEYPDGDGVVVWVREMGDKMEVSDYGEGLADQEFRSDYERGVVSDIARGAARANGIAVFEGRLGTQCTPSELGENVLRVASASAQVAASIACQRPSRRKESEENEFVRLVDETLRQSNVPVEREHRLQGSSGHSHRATIYVPHTHTILEPVTGHWNQVASVYTKFSDLAGVNGFHRYSLLDDRQESPGDDVRTLLVGVSDVITWSAHDTWLAQIRG